MIELAGFSSHHEFPQFSLLTSHGHFLKEVVYELQVVEEVEGVRQEVREVKGEEKGEINGEGERHTS